MSDKYTQNLLDQIDSLEYQLEQYKSLVKTVDPDNLPEENVVFYFGGLDYGFLEESDELDFKIKNCSYENNEKLKYISESDLIKLIKGDLQC